MPAETLSNDGAVMNKITPDFLKNLEYTNRLIPSKLDSRAWKIAKWVLIGCTAFTIFIVTITIDLSKNSFQKLFSKGNAQNQNESSSTIDTKNKEKDNEAFQNAGFGDVFNIENAITILQSTYIGFIAGAQKVSKLLVNPNNDIYQNIFYAIGATIPLCLAGGLVRGSIVSLAFNGTGYGIRKFHAHNTTPPENN